MDKDYLLPFGKGRLVSEGDELTIITWGAMVQKSIEAMQLLGISDGMIDVIDLRTLNPLDLELIEFSITKTSKVLIVHEDNITNGPGAEIAALISDKFFEFLDGPIRRVAAKDSPIPFNWLIEEKILPQVEEVANVIKELLEY